MTVGGPRLYPRTFIESGVEKIRAELADLLSGTDELATRFYNVAGSADVEYRLNGVGKALAVSMAARWNDKRAGLLLLCLAGILAVGGCTTPDRSVERRAEMSVATTASATPMASATTVSGTSSASITPTLTGTLGGPSPRYEVPSPDGLFIARYFDEYAAGDQTQRITIEDRQGATRHVVEYFIENPMSAPCPNLAIYEWSQDSSELYYYKSFGFDGGGQPGLWQGLDLSSIAIETGETQAVIPHEGLASFAFAPDQSSLIYSLDSDQPRRIRKLDWESGRERSVAVPIPATGYTQVGRYVWAPFEDIVVFEASSDTGRFLYRLDVRTLEVELILEFWEDLFLEWTVDGKLVYREVGSQELLELDVMTGQVRPVGTATPHP